MNLENWPATEMRSMMRDHLSLTTAEGVARLKSDWAADIAAYDKVHEQILHANFIGWIGMFGVGNGSNLMLLQYLKETSSRTLSKL